VLENPQHGNLPRLIDECVIRNDGEIDVHLGAGLLGNRDADLRLVP
jgi:hypothetical protein